MASETLKIKTRETNDDREQWRDAMVDAAKHEPPAFVDELEDDERAQREWLA